MFARVGVLELEREKENAFIMTMTDPITDPLDYLDRRLPPST